MTNYNYYEAVAADVLEYLHESYTTDELAEEMENRGSFHESLNDMLWTVDSVTGNASGSRYCNSYRAKECVFGDTETVMDALKEYCVEKETIAEKFLSEDWERIDVAARCYVLYSAINDALDAIEEELDGLELEESEEQEEQSGERKAAAA